MGELYLEAMAVATDNLAWQVYASAVPAAHKRSLGTAASGWNAALFDLAGDILVAHRALPNRLVISSDIWAVWGGAADTEGRPLFTVTAPANPVGRVSLTSTDGEVRELSFVVDPNLPADRGALFDANAFRAALGPVQTLTADVPAKLGRDYAVFRFGAFLPVDASGLGMFSLGSAPTAREGKSDDDSKSSSKKS